VLHILLFCLIVLLLVMCLTGHFFLPNTQFDQLITTIKNDRNDF